jgi:hypothetical protein
MMPVATSDSNALPLRFLHPDSAFWASLNTIASPASREPEPLVLTVLSFTVANALSIGLLVAQMDQCVAHIA